MSGPTDDLGRPLTVWGITALVALDLADAIGIKCGAHNGDCIEIACVEIHWPGSPVVPMCWAHRTQALHVADVFGIHITGRILSVVIRNLPEPDPSAERFAAMELT